ncbi:MULTISPECIES: LacI family DNA-binding transcriptional regulator [unclassified Microbacterium]|uniref:LacI family DNA-binding transcriptional regulator n=1 Tax=unclassified Microbacterium TaxID=2609290 RepID=UPI000EAA53A3|nr:MULTISPECIES: LacI family DNA-binding transcriptional regulator [unclassified Microbacterium]MBT2484104.1 LacI family DNA-binding transcriptional regulator [Microbacterium sp. ISL-108]RKN67050.1 LacI family transcriptional regulator [Microbacterium sp. CGR2]
MKAGGEATATLHDVARAAGVSIKTVSNVINGYPHIRPETRERVEVAIASLHYQPNRAARSLRSGRTDMIGLIVPDLRNPYFAELADDVMRAARERGFSVLIEQFDLDRDSELAALRDAHLRGLDGILHSVLTLEQGDAALLERVPVPMVLLGERIFDSSRDHVTMRNTDGARAATTHLLENGRRRILALGSHPGEELGSPGLRLRGYTDALAEAGIPLDDSLVVPVDLWHRVDGADAMRAVLDAGVDFDGVVAFNDSLALGALRVLLERGIRVPDEVAVIGFDDLDESRYSLPALSTIDPGRSEIARTAVELLVARITGTDAGPPREVSTDFLLVPRESTTARP